MEEACKGLLVLLMWWFRRREFDGIIDGMVYAGVVAAGFAFTENIQYLGMAYSDGGDAALTGTFIARCLFTPFAHPMFTVLTGIGIGIAATTRNRGLKVLAPVGGYLLAALSHAIWNLAAITGGAGLLSVYLVVEVPIFVAFVVLVVWARRREGRLIGRHLSAYADAGWLSPSEVQMLSTMSARRSARVWARTTGGRAMLRSMRRFQDSSSELALLRARMYHSAADAKALETERDLLQTITASRQQLLGDVLACSGVRTLDIASTIGPDLIALRRELHQVPELGTVAAADPAGGRGRAVRPGPRGHPGGVAVLGRGGAAWPRRQR